MSWGSRTNIDSDEDDRKDIVRELRDADRRYREAIGEVNSIVTTSILENSLYRRAADEIERLRKIAGLTEN